MFMTKQEQLTPEWLEAIRLILDKAAHMAEAKEDGSIEVLLKAGKPVTVRGTGARAVQVDTQNTHKQK